MKSFIVIVNSIVTLAALMQLCAATPIELVGQLRARQVAPSDGATLPAFQPPSISSSPPEPTAPQTSVAATLPAFQPPSISISPPEPSAAQTTGAEPTSPQIIPVPSASSLSAVPYIVQAGDTFSYIAAKFGTSVSAIETANPALTPDDLQIGASVIIPRNFAARSVGATYIVQPGDTFSSIAALLGTSVAALESANPNLAPTDLQIGDEIVVPGDITAPGNGTAPPSIGNSTLGNGTAVKKRQSSEQGISLLSLVRRLILASP